MEVVKKTNDYTIYQKRSKRYAVKDASRRWLTGDEKVKILVSEKLLDVPVPTKKAEEAPEAAEAPAEASAEEAAAEEEKSEEEKGE